MAPTASRTPPITPLRDQDFSEWQRLFRAYIAFYKASLPEEQYRKTFDRLIDPQRDLYGLVMHDPDDGNKLVAIAHFYPHQTPWSEKVIMHFNDLFVDPNVRAQGYGRKMIEAVRDKAKGMDCLRLQWATQHGNPARKLYDEMAECDFVEYRLKW